MHVQFHFAFGSDELPGIVQDIIVTAAGAANWSPAWTQRSFLTEGVSPHERFLCEFPSLSPFVSQSKNVLPLFWLACQYDVAV